MAISAFLWGLFFVEMAIGLGSALNCYTGHSEAYHSGGVNIEWLKTICQPGTEQCLKLECENEIGKGIIVKCGESAENCSEEVEPNLNGCLINGTIAAVTKCASCDTDMCWGTTPFLAPQIALNETNEQIEIETIRAEIQQVKNNTVMMVEQLTNSVELLESEAVRLNTLTMGMYKWNPQDCGPQLRISMDGLVLNYTEVEIGCNTFANYVRTTLPITMLPIKKQYIPFYFETLQNFESTKSKKFIRMGFCDHNMDLTVQPFSENNINVADEGGINVDDDYKNFSNALSNDYFEVVGGVIGMGLIHSPENSSLKCFSTYNGKLLGLIDLPNKYASMELFPFAGLRGQEFSLETNFGKAEWRFDPNQLLK